MEFKALESAGLCVFIVICGNMRGTDTAAVLLKAMPKILHLVAKETGPFIYYVYKDSNLKRAR